MQIYYEKRAWGEQKSTPGSSPWTGMQGVTHTNILELRSALCMGRKKQYVTKVIVTKVPRAHLTLYQTIPGLNNPWRDNLIVLWKK